MKGYVKMKYFSDITNKTYDSEKDCLDAERDFLDKQKAEEDAKKARASEISNQKREAAALIEATSSDLAKAYENYEKAEKNVKEIFKKAYDEAKPILMDAKLAVRKAQENNFNAVKAFNDKFGPYKTVYTGEKASRFFDNFATKFFSQDYPAIFDLFDRF